MTSREVIAQALAEARRQFREANNAVLQEAGLWPDNDIHPTDLQYADAIIQALEGEQEPDLRPALIDLERIMDQRVTRELEADPFDAGFLALRNARDCVRKILREGKLYAHPAPVGDQEAKELAYDDAHEAAVKMGYPSIVEALEHLHEFLAQANPPVRSGDQERIAELEAALVSLIGDADHRLGGEDNPEAKDSAPLSVAINFGKLRRARAALPKPPPIAGKV